MKRFLQLSTLVTLFAVTAILISLLAAALPSAATAQGQQTATLTATPTATLLPPYPPPDTLTPTTEPTARGTSERPLVVVASYDASTDKITPGIHFTLEIRLDNDGQLTATNLIATFASGDFFPSETGGVVAVNELEPGEKHKIVQPLIANTDLWGKYVASQPVTVSYTDPEGLSYSETFTITFPIAWESILGATATPTPTITPTALFRPQLVITSYETDITQLEPGQQFSLTLSVQNQGQANARQVTMVLGGGSTSSGEDGSGTPQSPGGVTGGSGDLTNFAPIGSSNVQSLGDLAIGASLTAQQNLVVNVSTNPGAYPLKISFVYTDERNISYVDDQVITLLVYLLPKLEISFYRDPNPLFAGQPNALPLQVVNLGRKNALLGNMEVTGDGADFTNNVILVGSLDPGNYITLDATMIPHQAGPLELLVTVNYTDDFNQPQKYSQSLTVDVLEAEIVEPVPEGIPGQSEGLPLPTGPETFWQKMMRFFRGLIGLESGQPSPEMPGEVPPEMPPPEGEVVPVPALKGP